MRIKTYVAAGILIAAARGTQPLAGKALALLEDPNREFITSDYLRMEIFPKPTYFGMIEELALYEEFFRAASLVLPFRVEHLEQSLQKACQLGLSALTAAMVSGCEEEKTRNGILSTLSGSSEVMSGDAQGPKLIRTEG